MNENITNTTNGMSNVADSIDAIVDAATAQPTLGQKIVGKVVLIGLPVAGLGFLAYKGFKKAKAYLTGKKAAKTAAEAEAIEVECEEVE